MGLGFDIDLVLWICLLDVCDKVVLGKLFIVLDIGSWDGDMDVLFELVGDMVCGMIIISVGGCMGCCCV